MMTPLHVQVLAEDQDLFYVGRWERDPYRVKCGKCGTGVVLEFHGEKTRIKTRCAICKALVRVEYEPR